MDHALAGAAGRRPGVFEEGQVEAGAAGVIAIEEVVDGGVVLVDGLLDHPEPEHPGVEIDVRLRVAGDRADVMDALEFHTQRNTHPEAISIPTPNSPPHAAGRSAVP